ncbi:helix-turn-helix domain-containing protein [Sphingobacterium corticis]|uniref:Helix-turn-helix domain-containing protein n=1 Tax=Sphingobacterium corticis TaxID=1812823 RepID=A0ABW5NDT6_9SPHI
MSFCERILNKDIRELKFDDIENYFMEPREETEYLEFKSGDGDFDESFVKNIIRTTAAFLNSSGGLLIWGAPRETSREKGKPKITQGDLVPLKISKSKDDLINKLCTSISYMPIGIKVEKLQKDDQYIYIFEVLESLTKPHQCTSNSMYYIRLDGQTKPAPHYIIEALFRQTKFSELRGSLKIVDMAFEDDRLKVTVLIQIDNLSRYAIEPLLTMSVDTERGVFVNDETYFNNFGQTPVHFGMKRSAEIDIYFNKNDINEKDEPFFIRLYFAGNNSLGRLSKYMIDLSHFKNSTEYGDTDYENIKTVVHSEENIPLTEIS